MIFMVGLVVGVVTGTVALLIFGAPLLLAKALGILWGDFRFWWALAVMLACVAGLARVAEDTEKASQKQDFLSVGFDRSLKGGVIVSTVGFGVLGYCLIKP